MSMRTLENVSLVALAIGLGAAHHLIDPPTWATILGVPVAFAAGVVHARMWARVRAHRSGR